MYLKSVLMETIGVKQPLTKKREEIPSSGGIDAMK